MSGKNTWRPDGRNPFVTGLRGGLAEWWPFAADSFDIWENRTQDLAVTSGKVQTWTGRLHGKVLTGNSVGSSKPVLNVVGGVNYLSFDSSLGGYFDLPNVPILDRRNCTVFVVLRRARDSNFSSVYHPTTGSDVDNLYFSAFNVLTFTGGGNSSLINAGQNLCTLFRGSDGANPVTVGMNYETDNTLPAPAAGTDTGGFFGLWNGGAFPFNGDVLCFIPVLRTMSVGERQTAQDAFTSHFNSSSRLNSKFWVPEGDSLTFGVQSTIPNLYSWPAQLARSQVGGETPYAITATGGETAEQLSTDFRAITEFGLHTSASVKTAAYLAGTNDLANNKTALQIQAWITTWINGMRSGVSGIKLEGCTVIARNFDVIQEPQRLLLNTWIKNSAGFDIVTDAAAVFTNANDLTLYDPDNTHLNNNGYSVMAGLRKASLISIGAL